MECQFTFVAKITQFEKIISMAKHFIFMGNPKRFVLKLENFYLFSHHFRFVIRERNLIFFFEFDFDPIN